MATKDPLGDKIKSKFENVYRISIPQRTYAIVRIDGKAFHTFTRGLEKPYCKDLSDSLDLAALALCKQMQGCKLAYGQSDEYSFLFTDLDGDDTEMWFNGNLQKISSISASIFTAVFNKQWEFVRPQTAKLAMFDARVFVIPTRSNVIEYFNWRQLDATKNSLNMLAACHFSHTELQSKKAADMHEMLHTKGINWNNFDAPFKRGRVIRREAGKRQVEFLHKKTKTLKRIEVEEMAWGVDYNIPVFGRNKAYLEALIP